MKRRDFLKFSLIFLASCAAPNEKTPDVTPSVESKTPVPEPTSCNPAPVVIPTRPAEIPDIYQVDDVGLHVTAQPVDVDPTSYRLKVSGLVENPLSFSLDELRCLPKVTSKMTLTCPGYFSDLATWSGTPLKPILDRAGVKNEASILYLMGADGYKGIVTLADGMRPENFLAYQLENGPVPILHGFPVRAALAGQAGSSWTKWLVEIKAA